MCVSQVGAVMLVALARFPALGTSGITSIPAVLPRAQRITEDHENHPTGEGTPCGGGHAAGVQVTAGRKRTLDQADTREINSGSSIGWTYERVVRARRARGLF